jgi:hypothetical protein
LNLFQTVGCIAITQNLKVGMVLSPSYRLQRARRAAS